MCVSSGPSICLMCLLYYGWQAKADTPNISAQISKQYDVFTDSIDATEDSKELYFMEKDFFLMKLMTKYGNGREIPFEGFEHMLHNLGLGGIFKFDHEVSCHRNNSSSDFLKLHSHHNHSKDTITSIDLCGHANKNGYTDEHYHQGDHDHTDEHDHTEEHDHTDDHDHIDEHEHIDEHDHTDDHDHTEEHDHTDDHDHIDEHDHTDDHDSSDKPVYTGDHDHRDEEKHGLTGDHMHNQTDDQKHEHADEQDHNHDDEPTQDLMNVNNHNDTSKHDHNHSVQKRGTDSSECLSAHDLLQLVDSDKGGVITKDLFKELCPSLLYQIDEDSCHSFHDKHTGFHGSHNSFHDHSDHDHAHTTGTGSATVDLSNVPLKVWGFSSIAVIVISLVGLLGVAVIPIMQKVFYNHMLQFLVALAVGALSGDALLHLFPHAIASGHKGHDHTNGGGHSHDTGPIYKGLCGLLGIYFFFFTERILTMFTEYKRKKKHKRNHSNKYLKDEEMLKVGEKLANSECDGMMMSIHPNKALRAYADEAHTEHCTISFENTTSVSHEHGQRKPDSLETCVDGDETSSMINNSVTASPKHQGHGHSHGIDAIPNSVASVAWMVILGDGIHNFCDGLAIGAAFINSITGGFSTSVAVFCHELPHEIGDFAMLLRAGMSPKQAIIYNCLSSILCFVGMLIGVAVGNLKGASLWVFSLVGGMFLYIALVDMLPELSSVETKKGEHPLCHLLLQGVGMCTGAGIMLTIALFEGDLLTILD
ncbi:zinc transporter ZIP10-like [Ruditapes philippinarum]|uniref:zinc transporter ZIP10-like n=1 Tax=Ruditapes philippinarum TaxID=129788 RepID=UPI00295BEF51|nr:zinc transporter ZIP10-like [Ruditapes philippinarum]